MTAVRRTLTEPKIKKVLTSLLASKGFDALTVSDIASLAGINRSTFYMHYTDKYDLLQQLIANAAGDIAQILTGDVPFAKRLSAQDIFSREHLIAVFKYLRADFAFVFALVKSGNGQLFMNEVKHVTWRNIIGTAHAETSKAVSALRGLPDKYLREIMFSPAFSVILLWLRDGGKDDPEAVADAIVALQCIMYAE